MAVATSMAILGGITAAKGLYDTVQATNERKQRQAELDAYQRQGLTNTYKNMQISTIGSDAMREESSRNMATIMNNVGGAGTRAIIGATPKVLAEQNNTNTAIQRQLDDQVQKRDYAIAQDDTRIQQMQEQREYQDLAGLGNAIDTAKQDANMGMNTMLNGMMAMGTNMGGAKGASSGNNAFKSSNYSIPQSIGFSPSLTTPSSVGAQPQGNSFNLYQYMNSLKPVKF